MKRVQDFARNAPVTATVAILAVIGAFAVAGRGIPAGALGFFTGGVNQHPWTIFTYFAVDSPLMALLSAYMLFQNGAAVESDVGRGRYIVMLATILAAGAAGTAIASALLHIDTSIMGSSAIAGPVLVLWGVHHNRQMISIFGTKPIRAYWVAVFGVVIYLGIAHPFAAVPFSMLGLVMAYLFGSDRIPVFPYLASATRVPIAPMGRGMAKPTEDYYAEAERRKTEREEKERLRKLFEGSIKDPKDRER